MTDFEIAALFFVLLCSIIFVAYMRRLSKNSHKESNMPNPDGNVETLGKAVLDLYNKVEFLEKSVQHLNGLIEEDDIRKKESKRG